MSIRFIPVFDDDNPITPWCHPWTACVHDWELFAEFKFPIRFARVCTHCKLAQKMIGVEDNMMLAEELA